jgi:CubicO group peptidase (beta-lactamase class C family)
MNANLTEPLQVISSWLEAQRDYKNIPSISAAIVIGDKMVWSDAFGYSDLRQEVKATDSTIYSICSISKLFTSIAIMQLRDRGLLNLDDPISEHLPWFNIEQAYSKSGQLTIRSILTHSSGLPRESDFPYWTDPEFPFPDWEQLRKKLPEQQTLYPASTFYQYSNLGMSLLGAVIEGKTGAPYKEYILEHLLKPLGMEDTHPELPENLRGSLLATGYSVESRDRSRDELAFFKTGSITPAVGLSSTVKDLAKFAIWQFKILDDIEDPILNGNTLREMHQVHWMDPDWANHRGLGFGINRLDGETLVSHTGGCPGYLSQFVLIPKKKWAFIVMVNGLGINLGPYVDGMYHILKSYEKEKGGDKQPDVNLQDYSGKYYTFWDGESIIVPWKDKLACFSLYYPDLKKPDPILKHIERDTFKRIRDDENLGEEIKFERDRENRVTRFWQHSVFVDKMNL